MPFSLPSTSSRDTLMNWIRSVASAAFLATTLTACGNQTSSTDAESEAAPGGGCGPFTASIEESKDFTPYEARRGQWPDPVLNPTGQEAAPLPEQASIKGVGALPMAWSITGSDGASYLYFSAAPITKKTTLGEFQRAGGIQIEVTDANAFGLNDLIEQIGDRAVPVAIGDSQGIVVWADPNESGIRLHNVYFESGGYLYGVLANSPARDVITAAREVACSTPIAG